MSFGTPPGAGAVLAAPKRGLSRPARGALFLGALIALSFLGGCGEALVAGKVGVQPVTSGESTVEVRASGTEGVRYFGSYGLLGDKPERFTDALGAGPTSYEVPVADRGPTYDVVNANFMKLEAEGYLRVAVLREGEVVAQKTTRDKEGVVTINYRLPAEGGDGAAGP